MNKNPEYLCGLVILMLWMQMHYFRTAARRIPTNLLLLSVLTALSDIIREQFSGIVTVTLICLRYQGAA